jgi:hypothetical protein
MLENLFIGVVSGVVASAIFLLLLFTLRPKLVFSNLIADPEGGAKFVFKILNKSKYAALDLEIQVSIVTPYATPGGETVWAHQDISLRKNTLFELPRFSKNDIEAKYALRFSTQQNLRSICNSASEYVVVKVKARHGLSGFSRVFSKKYHPKTDIAVGQHEFGDALGVR